MENSNYLNANRKIYRRYKYDWSFRDIFNSGNLYYICNLLYKTRTTQILCTVPVRVDGTRTTTSQWDGVNRNFKERKRGRAAPTHTHTHNEKRYYLIITSAWEFLVSTVIRSLDQYYIWANIIYEPITAEIRTAMIEKQTWSPEFSFPLYVRFNLTDDYITTRWTWF